MKPPTISSALQATGEQLAAVGGYAAIVVVGGAALAVSGLVVRATDDVDIIAVADRGPGGITSLRDAVPLPDELRNAAARVARDFALPADWLNEVVGKQFVKGLPPGIEHDITWRSYVALDVGFVGRRTLIALKLFAAADDGPQSVHVQDLVHLAPTASELDAAAQWVETQDASPLFHDLVAKVIDHVIRHVAR